MKFKTNKQKAIHHHTLDSECKNERTAMIMLLGQFKRILNNVISDYSLPLVEIEKREDYCKLRSSYVEMEKILIDSDFFFMKLGNSFNQMVDD
jgi:hypothetical protein